MTMTPRDLFRQTNPLTIAEVAAETYRARAERMRSKAQSLAVKSMPLSARIVEHYADIADVAAAAELADPEPRP